MPAADAAPARRALAAGALLALGYGLLAVACCGVVLDEAVDFAQVMSGAVRYPDGHPHQAYFGSSPTLMSDLALALWRLWPDPLLLSAVRNVLQVATTALAPFALTLALTRQPLAGGVAAAVTLSGTSYYEYVGAYLPSILPNYFSNGQVGMNLVVLCVALVLLRCDRAGGVLAGALPAIHPVMAVPAWPWLAAHVLLLRGLARSRGLVIAAILAFVVAAAYLLAFALRTPGAATALGAPLTAEAAAIHAGFTALDVHRQPFAWLSAAYLANPLALFAVIGLALACAPPASPVARGLRSLLLLAGGIWAWVWGWRLFGTLAGFVPTAVQVSMPNRFSQLSAMLLVPATLALFGVVAARARAPVLLRAGLSVLLLAAALCYVVSADRAQRYLLPLLWALSLGGCVHVTAGWRRGAAIAALVLLAGVLALVKDVRVGLAVAAGAAASLLALRHLAGVRAAQRLAGQAGARGVVVAGCLLMAGAVLAVGTARPIHDPFVAVSDYDRRLRAWLDANAPGEAVLGFLLPYSYLQAKTGHPVAADLWTLYMIAYRPDLALQVGRIARDLYGIDFANPPAEIRSILDAAGDHGVWAARRRAAWQRLGGAYGFRLVLAPAGLALDLDPVLAGERWTLYATGAPPPASAP